MQIWYDLTTKHHLAIMDGDEQIGCVTTGLNSREGKDAFAIGYHIDERYRGKGLMTKAVTEFIRLLGYEVYQASVRVDNIASQKVLVKCGFKCINSNEFMKVYLLYLDDHLQIGA